MTQSGNTAHGFVLQRDRISVDSDSCKLLFLKLKTHLGRGRYIKSIGNPSVKP